MVCGYPLDIHGLVDNWIVGSLVPQERESQVLRAQAGSALGTAFLTALLGYLWQKEQPDKITVLLFPPTLLLSPPFTNSLGTLSCQEPSCVRSFSLCTHIN